MCLNHIMQNLQKRPITINLCFSCHNFWQFRNLTYHVNVEKDESRRKERDNQIKGQKEQKHSWHFFRNRELQKWWKLQWHDNRRVDEHPQFLRGPTKNVSRNSGKNVAIKPHIYWPAIRPLKVKEGIYFWIQFPLSLKLEWGFWKTNWSTQRNFCVNSNLLFWNLRKKHSPPWKIVGLDEQETLEKINCLKCPVECLTFPLPASLLNHFRSC